MKILIIQSRICIGGPALHTILLTAHLNKRNFKTVLVGGALEQGEKDISFYSEAQNVQFSIIEEMGRNISIIKDIIAFIKLFRLIKKEKPNIIHTHTAKAGAIGRLAARMAHVPQIYHTFHGHTFSGYFRPIITKIIIYFEKLLAKISTGIIVISESQREDICKQYKIAPSTKVNVIPLGFDFERLAEPTHGFLDCYDESIKNYIKIGTIGRLVPVKDLHLLLNAFAKAKPHFNSHKAKLFIVGDGKLKHKLLEYSNKLGLQKDVIFTGSISNIQDVYADLDLVVLTSKNEGTPVSLIEAMYYGVPILATEVGGVSDIVPKNCGILIKNRHQDDVASALTNIITNKDFRHSFKNQGRDYVLDRFNITRMVNDIKNLYQRGST